MKDEKTFCITFYRHILAGLLMMLAFATSVQAQTTAFTYQGKLVDSGNPANGSYDLQFKLFDALSGGTQQGATLTLTSVAVSNGIFTVQLDFGACASCFNGAARYLEVAVKATSSGTYTTLSPRQAVTSTPYAINSAQLGGLAASSFLRNSTSQQASSNFNISGNGTAAGTLTSSIVNAVFQVNINGLRAFTVNGAYNDGVGTVFTASNTFAGDGAGLNTTPSSTLNNGSGKFNSFFGAGAGLSNTGGGDNSFFGTAAGFANTTGGGNSFFGRSAGQANDTGSSNAFFGTGAGQANTTGDENSFFGTVAGVSNLFGTRNAFFGYGAGQANTDGIQNAFFGYRADFNSSNTFGNNNTALGSFSTVTGDLANATAIGSRAAVTQSNSLVLGSIDGINNCGPITSCTSVKVGIGTTAPVARLQVQTSTPDQHLFLSDAAPSLALGNNSVRSSASMNGLFALSTAASHFGVEAGAVTVAAYGNARGNIYINSNYSGTGLTHVILQPLGGNVGVGVNPPLDRLHVFGDLRVGTGTTGCVKDADGTVIAGTCSSDARLKRNILPFAHLLDKVAQLQPVTFYWRSDEFKDRHFGTRQSFGLIAQEVEKILPELVTEDEQGYKAVNYSKLPLLSLQAIKELKAENDALKASVETLTRKAEQLDALKRLVCADHPDADLCKQP